MRKKNNNLGIRIGARYAFLIVVTIIIGFLINCFLFAPIRSLADENAWLGFYGSIVGAGIAGIVTLWGIKDTIESTLLNIKPAIRPIKTDFFLYSGENSSILITEKQMLALMEDYGKKNKFIISDIDVYNYKSVLLEIKENYKDTRWESVIDSITPDELVLELRHLCSRLSYDDAISTLRSEMPKLYSDIGSVIADKIIEMLRQDVCFNVLAEVRHQWAVYYWVYNVGAGNAVDVRIDWDFSKNYHKEIFDNLGFSDDEYIDMDRSFSLKEIYTAETDVILNSNGENRIRVEVPSAVILMIEHLFNKTLKNAKEKEFVRNNALIGEHKIAELSISCVDIHGKEHNERYNVIFRIRSTLQKYYGFNEEHFYLKFTHGV